MKKQSILRILCAVALFSVLAGQARAISFKGSRVPNTPLYDSRMFHFGFSLGMNFMDFSVKSDSDMGLEGDSLLGIKHAFSPGFSVGIVTDLRMGRWFNLRFIPTFSMASRTLTYTVAKPGGNPVADKRAVESIMVFLPLEVKWKAARMTDHRPYITAGVQYTLDMASRKNKKKEGSHEDEEYRLKLNRHDFGVTVGLGWDFFLPFNNKLAVEIKAFIGFMDMLTRENNIYTNRIESLNSRMLQVLVTFE